jgi:hypothetical protein
MGAHLKACAAIVLGMSVIAAFLHALLSDRPAGRSLMLANVQMTESARSLRVGAPVFAGNGTRVGVVSGISREPDGRIERLRVTTESSLGLEPIIIVRGTSLTIDGSGVRLALPVAELNRLPGVMLKD